MLSDPEQLDFSPSMWDAWEPLRVAELLGGLSARWFVVGGWALELFHDNGLRDHGDLEIAVPMWRFDLIRERLADYEFWVAGRERFWPVETAGDAYFEYQQTMVRDPESKIWRLDVMRIPDDGAHWICSSDRRVARPYDEAISHTSDDIPFLKPQWVLFYKSLHLRPKDQSDFEATLPLLSSGARSDLAIALLNARGPQHPWVNALKHRTGST
ncbi:MAG: hypothetical protein ACRDQA_24040 [Nocardioidaceae bacterium]